MQSAAVSVAAGERASVSETGAQLPPAQAAQAAAEHFAHLSTGNSLRVKSAPPVRLSMDSAIGHSQPVGKPPISRSKAFESFRPGGSGALGRLDTIAEQPGGAAAQELLVHKGTVGAGAISPHIVSIRASSVRMVDVVTTDWTVFSCSANCGAVAVPHGRPAALL